MHVDEVSTDVDLVRRLLRRVARVGGARPRPRAGRALYRLGEAFGSHWAVGGREAGRALSVVLSRPLLPRHEPGFAVGAYVSER